MAKGKWHTERNERKLNEEMAKKRRFSHVKRKLSDMEFTVQIRPEILKESQLRVALVHSNRSTVSSADDD